MYAKRYAYCISPSGPLTKPFAYIFATGFGGFANGLLYYAKIWYYPTPCRNRTFALSMSTNVKPTVLLHQPGKLNDKLCLSFICDEAQHQPTPTTKPGGGSGGWLTLDLCKIIKCLHSGLAQGVRF